MASTTNISFASPRFACRTARTPWRDRWVGLCDLLGGALLLAIWLLLWTVTWAAIAGPLSPEASAERARAAEVAASA